MGGAEPVKTWIIICIILAVLALFFFFCLNGYTYISYTLLFAIFLIVVFKLGSPLLIRIVSVITCIGLAYFCFCEYLIISNARTDENPEKPYLIVLGASVHGDVPSLSLQHRLEGAFDYLSKYPDSTAIVSGGQGKEELISEAQCMKEWLEDAGIPEGRIIPEDKSTSTEENLKYSWEILKKLGAGPDDVAILSSNYHLYRAKSMAKAIGMNPAGVKGNIGYPIYTLGMFIREAFGITHMWAFGK